MAKKALKKPRKLQRIKALKSAGTTAMGAGATSIPTAGTSSGG